MIRGEGTAHISGVTPQEVFDFVLDPEHYRKADTKVIGVTKIADVPDGMIARDEGRFLGRVRGSVMVRYQWDAPHHIQLTLVHGVPKEFSAWFQIDGDEHGTRVHHVEVDDMGRGILGWLHDRIAGRWLAGSVHQEVQEIKKLMEAGVRGRGLAAHEPAT